MDDKIEQLLKDEELMKELCEKNTLSDAVDFFIEHGIKITLKDLANLTENFLKAKRGEKIISDEELNEVSGGVNAKHIAIGVALGIASVAGAASVGWAIGTHMASVRKPSVSFTNPQNLPNNKANIDKNKQNSIDPGRRQEGPNWCWVASTQTLLNQNGIKVSQPEIYELALGERAPSKESERNFTGLSEDIQNAVGNLNKPGVKVEAVHYNCSRLNSEQLSKNISTQFERNGALSCFIGGHWVTIIGQNNPNNTFRVHDSLGKGGVFDVDRKAFCQMAKKNIQYSSSGDAAMDVLHIANKQNDSYVGFDFSR